MIIINIQLSVNNRNLPMKADVYWHAGHVDRNDRQQRQKHKSFVVWFTGLSGSGKSTLANAVEKRLFDSSHNALVLDGDNIRHGLCSDLGFSEKDRHENIRRIGEVSKLFIESGTIILAAFISPYVEDREQIRSLLDDEEFYEVFCDCDLQTCEDRDPKGIYKRARNGEIANFTGISAPYEKPVNPDVRVNSAKQTIEEEVEKVIEFLTSENLILS